MTYKLMVKTHNITGLKYLCKTERDNAYVYLGSGTYWKKHLKQHGKNISTQIIFETDDKVKFKQEGLYYSSLWNIVESKEWANFRPENGDGGDTVSKKFWITNGAKDQYNNIGEAIPLGWQKGRSTGAFSDREKQKELSSRVDRKKAGDSIKQAWAEGRFIRDHSKCGVRGEQNSSKRDEVRKKIGKSNSKHVVVKGIPFESIKAAVEFFGVKRHIVDKWRKNERHN